MFGGLYYKNKNTPELGVKLGQFDLCKLVIKFLAKLCKKIHISKYFFMSRVDRISPLQTQIHTSY